MEQSGGEIRGVWIVGKASAKTESPCIHGVYGTWKKAIAALEGIRRHYIDDGGVCPSECSFTPVEDGQCLLYIKASEMRTHTFSAVEYQKRRDRNREALRELSTAQDRGHQGL